MGAEFLIRPTYGNFRTNPLWDLLRGDPRSEALVQGARAGYHSLKSAFVLLRVRSRWQLHRKRELLHHVNGCKIGRGRCVTDRSLARGTKTDRMAADRKSD